MNVNVKLIDPTYQVRSVPANASDQLYCSLLAQSAVHGAMAGYTGFTVGMINTHFVMIPIGEMVGRGRCKVDVKSRMWQRLLTATGQPRLDGGQSHGNQTNDVVAENITLAMDGMKVNADKSSD
jgi:6-phosphofructokinase 1